jgi:tetraacyldisaccharide 4'-kinase
LNNSFLNKIYIKYLNKRLNRFVESPTYSLIHIPKKFPKYFTIQANAKVISVGNLSFGGSGKTPFIETLINQYLPISIKKVIVSRGYKRKFNNNIFCTFEDFDLNLVDKIGDEAAMLLRKTKVPVAISGKKYEALLLAEKIYNPDVAIIDDGFQHRWIKKDLDILIIDEKTLKNPKLLPTGRLREPLDYLKYADIILISEKADLSLLSPYSLNSLILPYKIEVGEPYLLFQNSTLPIDISLENEKFVAISGIANSERFNNSLKEKLLSIVKYFNFNDHYNYSTTKVKNILNQTLPFAKNIITTEKDAIKLMRYEELFKEKKVALYVLPIQFQVIDEANLMQKRINRLFSN